MIQLTNKIWAVEVQEECTWPNVWNNQLCSGTLLLFPLPAGDWEALFSSKHCNEIDARKVVKQALIKEIDQLYSSILYKNYTPKNLQYYFDNALESMQSLIRSKGCDINKNWAIIQKL